MTKINKLNFFILLSIVFSFETSLLIFKDEGSLVFFKYFSYILLVQLLFYLFIKFIILKLKNLILKNILISLILAFNLISLKFSYSKIYLSNDTFFQLVIFIFFFLIILFIISNLNKNKIFNLILIFSSTFLIIIPILFSFFSGYSFSNMKTSLGLKNIFKISASQSNISVKNQWNKINFIKKPDIYVITFDSVPDIPNIKKILNKDELELEKILTNEGRIFANNFAMRIPTSNALNSYLMLDQKNFKIDHRRFSGQIDSLLFLILRNNGYKITTGYAGNYLGRKKGKYIDNYITMNDSIIDSTICLEKINSTAYIIPRSFFFCNIFYFKFDNKSEHSERHGTKNDVKFWPSKILEEIGLEEKTPQFKMFHMYRPIGHTPGDYKTNDKKMLQEFMEDDFKPGVRELTSIIKEIVSVSIKKKNDHIIIISSDHGPWMSRTYGEKDKFFINDRHNVISAVINSQEYCSKKFVPFYTRLDNKKNKFTSNDEYSLGGFTSLGRVLTGYIKCLSDPSSKDVIRNIVDFDSTYNFSEYLFNN